MKLHELRSGMVASCFLMASASLTLYILRFGFEFWMSIYLKDTLGKDAGGRMFMLFIFWWQIGGFVGTLAAGPLTDRLGGERLPAASAASVAMLAVLLGWHSCSAAALAGLGFSAGCACFGNRVLLMLAIRQAVPLKWGGRAEALNFLFAEFGGVLAGWPLITMLERLGGMRHFKAVLAAAAGTQSAFLLLAWLAGAAASGAAEKPQGPRSCLAALRRALLVCRNSRSGATVPVKPPRLVPVSSSENSHEM
jgi:sugar phosphate permease